MPRPARIDIIGMRYGRLMVSGLTDPEQSGKGSRRRKAIAVCDCGNEVTTEIQSILSGATSSCGCARESHGHTNGGSLSPTYTSWAMMLSRCRNPNNLRYSRYGGRGIKVCDAWLDFKQFLADMGERPNGTSIERVNNDGDYEPGNCRWADAIEQMRNRSVSILVSLDGDVMTLKECCRLVGEDYQKARRRYVKGLNPITNADVTVCRRG